MSVITLKIIILKFCYFVNMWKIKKECSHRQSRSCGTQGQKRSANTELSTSDISVYYFYVIVNEKR